MTEILRHIGPAVFWGTQTLILLIALTFTILTLTTKQRLFTYAAIGSTAIVLVLSTLPNEPAPGISSIIIGIVGMTLAVLGGGPTALLALHLATRNSVPPGIHGGILVTDNESTHGQTSEQHEVLRGGLMIGLLERLAIAGTIIAGIPEGLAVVVAIKGVGRFTELGAPETRERFIIGTLASMIWASAIAAMIRLVIT
jgi:hypothetical protein